MTSTTFILCLPWHLHGNGQREDWTLLNPSLQGFAGFSQEKIDYSLLGKEGDGHGVGQGRRCILAGKERCVPWPGVVSRCPAGRCRTRRGARSAPHFSPEPSRRIHPETVGAVAKPPMTCAGNCCNTLEPSPASPLHLAQQVLPALGLLLRGAPAAAPDTPHSIRTLVGFSPCKVVQP